uniref:Glyoxalase domain-containing protein 4 n=1 Tax=Salmo trutta TaxID=8032 RepID=A0A674B4E0_SALTR
VALRRALHFVFKVGDRSKTATFYRDVLGMKIYLARLSAMLSGLVGPSMRLERSSIRMRRLGRLQ